MKHVPNILSISRIFMGASILFIYPLDDIDSFNLAILIIMIALLTDIFDGIIARKFNAVSPEGYIWDGLGDRSFYVSLILMLFIKYRIHVFIVWLLIFREIAIYAFRVMTPNWRLFKEIRKISLVHAVGIRMWILGYLVCDTLKFYASVDISGNLTFISVQYSIIITTIIITYFAIFLYLRKNLLR